MAWEFELAKSFRQIGLESWPDFAEESANKENGHVVWGLVDEFTTEMLDQGFTQAVVAALDFRATTRTTVDSIRKEALDFLEQHDQIEGYESAEWHYDPDQKIRGVTVLAILNPNPPIKPDLAFTGRSFSLAFSAGFA